VAVEALLWLCSCDGSTAGRLDAAAVCCEQRLCCGSTGSAPAVLRRLCSGGYAVAALPARAVALLVSWLCSCGGSTPVAAGCGGSSAVALLWWLCCGSAVAVLRRLSAAAALQRSSAATARQQLHWSFHDLCWTPAWWLQSSTVCV